MISGSQAYLCSLVGRKVRTNQSAGADDWIDDAIKDRRWGVCGKIVKYHTDYSYTYSVQHLDGTKAFYEPKELELL